MRPVLPCIAQFIFFRLKLGFHGREALCNKFGVQFVQIDLPTLFSVILLLRNFVDRGGKQINLIEIFPHADSGCCKSVTHRLKFEKAELSML